MSSMHVAIIRSVQNGKTYHSKLLRRSFRDDQGRVQKKTLANLSHLPDSAIDLLRAHLVQIPKESEQSFRLKMNADSDRK